LEDLVGQLVNAGTGFSRSSVAGNKPSSTELCPFPCQAAQSGDDTLAIAGSEQEQRSDQRQSNTAGQHEIFRIT